MNDTEIECNLAEMMTERGLTERELARALGLTQPAVHYLRTGANLPSLAIALTIANKFGVPVEEIWRYRTLKEVAYRRICGEPTKKPSRRKPRQR